MKQLSLHMNYNTIRGLSGEIPFRQAPCFLSNKVHYAHNVIYELILSIFYETLLNLFLE